MRREFSKFLERTAPPLICLREEVRLLGSRFARKAGEGHFQAFERCRWIWKCETDPKDQGEVQGDGKECREGETIAARDIGVGFFNGECHRARRHARRDRGAWDDVLRSIHRNGLRCP